MIDRGEIEQLRRSRRRVIRRTFVAPRMDEIPDHGENTEDETNV
jgi:hypothetical protein